MSNPIMCDDDVIADLQRERDQLAAMNAELRAERDALAERLRQTPDTRDIIGHLRAIRMELQSIAWADARRRVADLLRRLDESQ